MKYVAFLEHSWQIKANLYLIKSLDLTSLGNTKNFKNVCNQRNP